MQRKNLFFMLAVVAVALGLMALTRLLLPGDDLRVVIRRDGAIVYDAPLSQDASVPVQGEWGYNLVRIEDGSVWIVEADCRDQLCIHQGHMDAKNIATRSMGNTIVCLPHRLTVTLSGAGED